MSLGLDLDVSAQLCAAVNGLSARMDRQARLGEARAQQAAQEYQQIPFVINLTIAAGAGSLNPVPSCGPDIGFWWSLRRLSATGFTAGQVNLFIDSTSGEPVAVFTGSSVGTYVNTYGKGHQMLHPGSNLAITASGITGTVAVYGAADQIASHLLPWYAGAVRH
jgi:hypothetical protein